MRSTAVAIALILLALVVELAVALGSLRVDTALTSVTRSAFVAAIVVILAGYVLRRHRRESSAAGVPGQRP